MAEKIQAANLRPLTNDAFYGFCNDVVHQLKETVSKPLDDMTAFVEAVKAFDAATKSAAPIVSSDDISDADLAADGAWRGLNAYLKAMMAHPDELVRDAVARVADTFWQYENPTELAYATEYGIMERLIADMKRIPADVLERSGTAPWIRNLEEKCAAFISLYTMRIQDKSLKATGLAKDARNDASKAYRAMVEHINALLVVDPTEELSRFAGHVNTLIAAMQVGVKSRKARAANKRD